MIMLILLWHRPSANQLIRVKVLCLYLIFTCGEFHEMHLTAGNGVNHCHMFIT